MESNRAAFLVSHEHLLEDANALLSVSINSTSISIIHSLSDCVSQKKQSRHMIRKWLWTLENVHISTNHSNNSTFFQVIELSIFYPTLGWTNPVEFGILWNWKCLTNRVKRWHILLHFPLITLVWREHNHLLTHNSDLLQSRLSVIVSLASEL